MELIKNSNSLVYVGVNDHEVDLFEGQYTVPNGMAYNSYLILDEKIAVLDTVDAFFTDEWLQNIHAALNGKTPSYLIVQHMEPDHSAGIAAFLKAYPEAAVVASAKAFTMMQNFYGLTLNERQITVTEGSTLSLGTKTLTFIAAPMVHWPEVLFTYDADEETLFSADAFGKFGALDVQEDWDCEARRYYFGIVGKFGPQVQSVLKKAAALNKTDLPVTRPGTARGFDPLFGAVQHLVLLPGGNKRRFYCLHLGLRQHQKGRRAAGKGAKSRRLPQGCHYRLGAGGYGRSGRGRVSVQQVSAGNHHLQRRHFPLYARVY